MGPLCGVPLELLLSTASQGLVWEQVYVQSKVDLLKTLRNTRKPGLDVKCLSLISPCCYVWIAFLLEGSHLKMALDGLHKSFVLKSLQRLLDIRVDLALQGEELPAQMS